MTGQKYDINRKYANFYDNNRKKVVGTKQRILEFIDYKQLSKQEFFRQTSLKRGFLDADKLNTSIPDTFIATIIATFPEVNIEWLITGRGEMLREECPNAGENSYKNRYYELLEKYNALLLETLTKTKDTVLRKPRRAHRRRYST